MIDSTAPVNKNVISIVVALTSFIFPLMMSSVNVALPAIGEEFAMEAVLLAWVTTIFSLTSALFQIPMGRLADIVGRKKIFTYGILIQVVATLLCAIASSATWLIAARGLQSFGGAMTFGTSMAILTSVFPPGGRGKVIGVNLAMVYLGLSTGPFIGGVLTQHFGWRSIFYVGTLLALVVAVLIFWKMKGEWAEAKGERYDTIGAIALCLALGAFMYGFSVLPSVPGIFLVPLGLLGLAAFFRWESRVSSPILDVNLFRGNIVFVFSNLATLISYGATTSVAFFLSLYLQCVRGMSPQNAGLVLMVQPIIQVIFNPISGRMADRIEPRLVASAGIALNCVGLALLVFLGQETTLWYILVSLIILGTGLGFFASPNTTAVMGSVEKRWLGVASGTLGTMRSIGMMLSMGISMILFSIYLPNTEISPASYPAFLASIRVAFIIFTALCFGAVFAQLAGRKMRLE